ncbi:hypothetical protein ElyMa_005439900 [Elysia marginata]|uniref:Uncharacterized protein n=1 Tax=Elysia marginata TaxID=1093978 RepID=A0AAV4EKX4_9GAST|nr:hypothetical protein ElyMa_005439900 [Elysia marginata]
MRTQEKSRWQVTELSVSLKSLRMVPLNQKVLQVVMRTQRTKIRNIGEQLILLTSPVTAQAEKKKKKDLDIGVDGNKQSEDTFIWKRELPCDLMEVSEHLSPFQKKKYQTVSKMIFDKVKQQLGTVEKEWLFTNCKKLNRNTAGISKRLDIH